MIYAAPLHLTANDSPGCVDAALVRDAGPSRTRVVVCSHSRLLREGVALALAEAKLIDVRGTFDPTNSPSALERMGPDVLLLDAGADAPCELPGILRKVMPALRIVVFAVADEQLNVVAWAEAGVSGHVGREGGIAELIAAIDAAMRGEAFCSPSLASLLFARLAEL